MLGEGLADALGDTGMDLTGQGQRVDHGATSLKTT
jgi:hypothetical protein